MTAETKTTALCRALRLAAEDGMLPEADHMRDAANEIERLRAALTRLGSSEAFILSGHADPETIARLEYARAALQHEVSAMSEPTKTADGDHVTTSAGSLRCRVCGYAVGHSSVWLSVEPYDGACPDGATTSTDCADAMGRARVSAHMIQMRAAGEIA